MWLSFSQRLPDGVKNQRRATKHGIPTIPRIIKLPIIYPPFYFLLFLYYFTIFENKLHASFPLQKKKHI